MAHRSTTLPAASAVLLLAACDMHRLTGVEPSTAPRAIRVRSVASLQNTVPRYVVDGDTLTVAEFARAGIRPEEIVSLEVWKHCFLDTPEEARRRGIQATVLIRARRAHSAGSTGADPATHASID